eukprot:jgi/Mesvir1/12956/Mv05969-RA.1
MASAGRGRSLTRKFVHLAGLNCVAYNKKGDQVITCGADCSVKLHNAATMEKLQEQHEHTEPLNALAVSPLGDNFAVGGNDQMVKIYSLPGVEFLRNAARFTLPVRAIAYSPSGSVLAVGGDDEGIKLVDVSDGQLIRVLKGVSQGSVKCIAFDPNNDFIASSGSNGTVVIWSVSEGAAVHTFRDAAPRTDADSLQLNHIAWHPDGSLLAIPSRTGNSIRVYQRGSWKLAFELGAEGAHRDTVTTLRWSPNGLYLASAGMDHMLMLWDVTKRQDLDRHKHDSVICGLAWHPTVDAIVMIDQEGRFGVADKLIPAHMKGPADMSASSPRAADAIDREELLRFDSDGDDAARSDGDGSEYSSEDDDGHARSNAAGSDDDAGGKGATWRGDARAKRGPGRKGSRRRRGEGSGGVVVAAPAQPAFQPGSTSGGAGKRRFLAYTLLGSVDFHDTSVSRGRFPALTDYYGFRVAALSESGVAFASPRRGDKEPATLMYRPIDSWASNSDWTLHVPDEDFTALAVGRQWVAVASSQGYLRIFSASGVLRFMMSLPGPAVAMAANNNLLAVTWHAASPSPEGDQRIEYALYNVDPRAQEKLQGGPLPLGPQATLTWLGFSAEGLLATGDSQGVVRLRCLEYGGSWVPVFSSAAERKSSEESHWVVGLDSTQLFCVVLKAPNTYPQVMPRPVLSVLKLHIPVVSAENNVAVGRLEEEFLRGSLTLAQMRATLEEGAQGPHSSRDGGATEDSLAALEDAVLQKEAELDRCLLRLFAAACKGERFARALELSSMLTLHGSLEGALRLANTMRMPPLAERMHVLLEEKWREEEEERQAAAAHARAPGPTLPSAAAASNAFHTPAHARAPVHNLADSPLRQKPAEKGRPVADEDDEDDNGPATHNDKELASPKAKEAKKPANGSMKKAQKPAPEAAKAPVSIAGQKMKELAAGAKQACVSPTTPALVRPSNPFSKAAKPAEGGTGTASLFDSVKRMQAAAPAEEPKKDAKRKAEPLVPGRAVKISAK